MSKLIRIFWFFLLLSSTVSAQIQQPERIELEIKDGEDYYEVVSAGDRGILLFRELGNAYDNKNRLWEVLMMDTAFNRLWKREYLLNVNYKFTSYKLRKDGFYMLFSRAGTGNKSLELVKIDINTSEVSAHSIKNVIPFSLSDFEITDKAALISGYFNYRPVVFYFNFNEGVPRVLPGLYDERKELVQIKVSEHTFDVILAGYTYDKRNTLFLKTFDHDGNLLKNVALDTQRRKGLIFGKSKNHGNRQLVAGIYGLRNSEYSRGVFVASVDPVGEHTINFYNYGDFKNFFNYMRDRREKRVKNRIERRKIKNKRLKFNYRLLVHEIKEVNGQYVLLGEAFYPKFRTVTGNYNGIYTPVSTFDNGIFRTNRIFEGYRYTHAVVIGFDKDGKMLWDNSFEINDILSRELEQFVNISVKGDKAVLLYIQDDVIRSKVIREGEVLEEKAHNKLRLKFENDHLTDAEAALNGLKPWYGDAFYAFGVHNVRNLKDNNVQINRKVFFVNKVIYE